MSMRRGYPTPNQHNQGKRSFLCSRRKVFFYPLFHILLNNSCPHLRFVANMSDPSSHTQELLEKENDDLVQSLKSKVATLKNVS